MDPDVPSDVVIEFYTLFYKVPLYVTAGLMLIVVPYVVFRSYFRPMVYVKGLREAGFDHIRPGPDRAGRIEGAQKARRSGAKLPPPYPNGWFAVADTRELKIKHAMAVDAFGQNLCVYRGADGAARCVDAYCPHLGANLGVGGAVCGNCIECPFHQWRFGEDGALVTVPGAEAVPKGVSIKTWRVAEADGAVWVWHDAEGRAPLWDLADAPELEEWGLRGTNQFTVSCHVQEIPENGADVAHLNAVHSPSFCAALRDRYPALNKLIGSHQWTAEWRRAEDHTANIRLTHDYKIFKADCVHLDIHVTQIGPGHVRLRVSSPFGPMLISQTVTPLAPLQQRVVHRVYSPNYNAVIGFILNIAESLMIERDIAIWNSKRYVSAPAYVRADRTIRAFRSWFSQFYSEHSVSFRDAQRDTLDW